MSDESANNQSLTGQHVQVRGTNPDGGEAGFFRRPIKRCKLMGAG